MSTSRTPPVPPKGGEIDKPTPETHRKVDKVEKISEVDDETRSRTKFRQYVDGEKEKPASGPTPFDLFSGADASRSTASAPMVSSAQLGSVALPTDPAIEEASQAAVPSPAYSPSPTTVLQSTAAPAPEPEPPLPSSQEFWTTTGEPVSSSQKEQPQMEETPSSLSRTTPKGPEEEATQPSEEEETTAPAESGVPLIGKKKGMAVPEKAAEPPPNGLSRKQAAPSASSPKQEEALAAEKKKEGPQGIVATSPGAKFIGALPQRSAGMAAFNEEAAPSALTEKNEKQKGVSLERSAKAQGKGPIAEAPEEPGQPARQEEERERGGKKSRKEETETIQIQSPTTAQLPDFAIPIAGAAAAAAKPYLGPEALAIYFHMVGTITAMVSPKGDSRTDFILNAPSFANSKFYGATISIERFSTAPYQLNIRLTGSNEAVALFNQNIPNLLKAFQNDRFTFAINRIEAVYERPLIRRKVGAEEKSERDSGFGGEMGRGAK